LFICWAGLLVTVEQMLKDLDSGEKA